MMFDDGSVQIWDIFLNFNWNASTRKKCFIWSASGCDRRSRSHANQSCFRRIFSQKKFTSVVLHMSHSSYLSSSSPSRMNDYFLSIHSLFSCLLRVHMSGTSHFWSRSRWEKNLVLVPPGPWPLCASLIERERETESITLFVVDSDSCWINNQ